LGENTAENERIDCEVWLLGSPIILGLRGDLNNNGAVTFVCCARIADITREIATPADQIVSDDIAVTITRK
jgi:hypothetical protein